MLLIMVTRNKSAILFKLLFSLKVTFVLTKFFILFHRVFYWTLLFCWEIVKFWVKVNCLSMSKSNSYTLTSWDLHILLPMRLRTMTNLPLLWVQMLTVCRKCWPYLSPLECLCPEECSVTETDPTNII